MSVDLPMTQSRRVLTLVVAFAFMSLAGVADARSPPAPAHPAPSAPAVSGGPQAGTPPAQMPMMQHPPGQMSMMQHQLGQMPMMGHGGAAANPQGPAASPPAAVDEHDHGSGVAQPAPQPAK